MTAKRVPVETSGQLLTSAETARRLNLNENTLTKWRMRQLGPEFVRVGPKTVRYKPEAVDSWLAEQTGRPMGEPT